MKTIELLYKPFYIFFTVSPKKKYIVNELFSHPWFYRLFLKKFCFNVINKYTSIWGSEFSIDSNSRYLLEKLEIKLLKKQIVF